MLRRLAYRWCIAGRAAPRSSRAAGRLPEVIVAQPPECCGLLRAKEFVAASDASASTAWMVVPAVARSGRRGPARRPRPAIQLRQRYPVREATGGRVTPDTASESLGPRGAPGRARPRNDRSRAAVFLVIRR